MLVLELIPIGTLLAVITTQVIETAVAAQDVLIEKESFKLLAKYILDIHPVLGDLQLRDLKDSPAVRTALESLQEDLKKARNLINNCTYKPKMYLLIHCRSIVKDAQGISRDLAKSLQLMSLAIAEVEVDISMNVNRLKDQMNSAQFQASASKLSVINKLEQGLREHRTDQGFANDLLKDIARAVGISGESSSSSSEINKELASFKKEKEEAALRKELEEEAFMEQVISLLSRADGAYIPGSSRSMLRGRVDRADIVGTELIAPLKSFICPLNQEVMTDPVSLSTGSCFERASIQAWFAEGNTSDPTTHEELEDKSLRANIPLRQSIEEWQERNYCIGILKAKAMLESGVESQQIEALQDTIELCNKSTVNKDWIAKEGLVSDMVFVLKSHSRDVKIAALRALHALVKNSPANKELLGDAGGVEQTVRCLGRETSVGKAAAALLLELLNGNERLSIRIGRERSAILLLVTLLSSRDKEAARFAGLTLDKLANDTDNIVKMAEANWCTPLIARLSEGTEDASKVVMAKALGTLKLTNESKTSLAEKGAILPLVKMMDSGKLDTRLAALSALRNLSTYRPVKSYIAKAGAIPLILNQLLAGMSPFSVREAAAGILDHLAADDGVAFFVDANGDPVDAAHMIENLLAEQENSATYPVIQSHILHTLLGFVSPPNSDGIRDTMRAMHGIPKLLPLVGKHDRDLQGSVIQILWFLSDKGGPEIADYLVKHQKFRTILKLVGSTAEEDVQTAAAGLVAALPRDATTTAALIDADAIRTLIHALKEGTSKVKEAATGALLRFTDSSDVERQHLVANLDAHALLIRLVQSGTTVCRARAAMALRDFSSSTTWLSVEPYIICRCMFSSRFPTCAVHRGTCTVKTTFCIVEAEAIPGLVSLINDDRGEAAEAALEALETLVSVDNIVQSGAHFLHKVNAISPIIGTLADGTPELQEKAVNVLMKIFVDKEMNEEYKNECRIPLVELASSGSSNHLKKKAAKLLAQLEFIHDMSTYY